MSTPCDQLDAYLLDLLEPEERTAFGEHLSICSVCRRDLELQRRIDDLLVQAADLEAAPPMGLRFKHKQRFRRSVRWVALAGAMLAAVWLFRPRGEPHDAESVAIAPPSAPAVSPPRVSVQLGDNVIARRIETGDPRVTILWTYPVLETRPLGGS